MTDRMVQVLSGLALVAAVAIALFSGGADDPARPGYGTQPTEISHTQAG